jgi:hypothetical protein
MGGVHRRNFNDDFRIPAYAGMNKVVPVCMGLKRMHDLGYVLDVGR